MMSEIDDIQILGDLVENPTSEPQTPEPEGQNAIPVAVGAGLLGMALGNILPDPSDPIHFLGNRWVHKKYERGEIGELGRFVGDAGFYYLPSFFWYGGLALVLYKTKGTMTDKLKWAIGVLSLGGIAGLAGMWILKDK